MVRPLSRRRFVTLSAGAAAAAATSGALDRAVAADAISSAATRSISGAADAAVQRGLPTEAQGLTHYQIGPHIWVRWNNEPLLVYRAHPTQKGPYVHPLAGPVSGRSLTAESALPWPHHRSLFFGCDFVNGGNYWQDELERGQIVSRGPAVAEANDRSVAITDACDWRQPGQPVQMRDERRFTLSLASPRVRTLDIDITWTALVDVTITKNNHSLVAVRAAHDLTPWGGGRLVSSEGQEGEAATFGKPARWCAFVGRRTQATSEPIEGIALMDHPTGPWAPCPWFTRDYGFMSPTPFNWIDAPWRLEAGQSVRIRHRVVLFAGTPADAGLDALYDAWVSQRVP